MGKIKFSEEQLEAINKKNIDVSVSAAAGSGKTAVLVERIIRRICDDNVDINKLLIVTFTNAAANSMRSKIKKAIKSRIREGENTAHLKRQLILSENANICTVHAFCLSLLKKYSYMLPENVPSSFTLTDNIENSIIKDKVLSEIIGEYYEKEDFVFERLSECYGSGSNDDSLINLILSLYNSIISIPEYEKWIKEQLISISDRSNFANTSMAEAVLNYIDNVLKSAAMKYECAIEIISCNDFLEKYQEPFTNEYNEIMEIYREKDLFLKLGRLEKLSFENFSKYRLPESYEKSLVKGQRDKSKDLIKKISEKYSLKILKANLESLENNDIINKLFEVILEFDKRFKEEKYKNSLLDFNDLEHLTISLISKNGELKPDFYSLRDNFVEIMVDEYQDTNDVQERIFTLLKKDNNLFTVGDVKQSIYRFRNANPRLFINRMSLYENSDKGALIKLNANYRCSKSIIDVINHIFSFVMTKDISGIDYKKDNSLIYKGEGNDKEGIYNPELKLVYVEDDSETTSQAAEARMIAKKIREMIDNPDFIVNDRRLKYSDIVILSRSFNDKTLEFLDELSFCGIPVTYDDKTSFFETPEILNMVAFLKIINNPYDDIAFAAVLRNIFLYSDDELLRIRLEGQGKSLYEIFINSNNTKDKNIVSYIKELQKLSIRSEIHQLIEKIYKDTFFDIRSMSADGGIKKGSNLSKLTDIARNYESTEFKGISSFIDYLGIIVKNKEKMQDRKTDNPENVVKVMSVHKSKGMEFPVVILVNMNKSFNNSDSKIPVSVSNELGIGFNVVNPYEGYRYKTIFKKIIEDDEKKENILEEMRILYVALTRAQNKLIMSGTVKAKEDWYKNYLWGTENGDSEISYVDFLKINSYLDIVIPPLLNNSNWKNIIPDIKEYSVHFPIDISLEEGEDDKKAIESDLNYYKFLKELTCDLSEEKYNKIFDNLSFSYDNKYIDIPKKISVSELKDIYNKSEEAKNIEKVEIYSPEFGNEKTVTNRERGILIHYILEKIDLNKIKGSNKIRVILDFMNEKPYLKEKLTLQDIKKIEAFFNAPIGIKMIRSKKIMREQKFLVRVGIDELYGKREKDKIILQGIIDCCFFDSLGKLYLVDYKYVNKTEEQIKETYSFQIDLYKKALSEIMKINEKDIKACIWDINKELCINFN